MFRERDGSCDADAGTSLLGSRILHSVYTSFAAKPKISVQGNPEAWLEVVADVGFKCGNGSLRLGSHPRKERVSREIFGIGGEEPSGRIAVQNEVVPALGVSEFRFQGPTIISPIKESGGVVLSRGSNNFQ